MQNKWIVAINIIFLVVVAFFLSVFGLKIFSDTETVVDEEECVEVNKVNSFIYESCYDAYTKNIFVNVERSRDTYRLKALEFSFFDVDEQRHRISDVPNIGESRSYKISAEKNPGNLDVRMDIVKDFSAEICSEPRSIFVGYCPSGNTEDNISGEINPIDGSVGDDFVEVNLPEEDSDLFSGSLVEKEAVWESTCSSSWECKDWEACEDGVQRRTCKDLKDCVVPTNKPDTVRYCDNMCREDWECTWSECKDGFTTPSCTDLNECGTTFNLPTKLSCEDSTKRCVPDVVCSGWSECDVDYNFLDLVGGSITDLTGSKSRLCVDRNGCSNPKEEMVECSVNIDVYTKRFVKCGKEYVGIYNRLNNDLLVRIDSGTEENPRLNLYLDEDADSEYCDYCFDGKLNGDETGIDCGGGCVSCEDKYGKVEYERTFWDRLFGWV